ncbi:MAG: SDR family oxidoreductase [Lentisphaeria bacterium]|nr:SDR family oxidoreductase [Lentisphaeria bacterium]NQZ69490.1 SDR family oxidoreductase [Lentisphaeria bacterium]
MSNNLNGKVALIAGASRGIGRSIALRLAQDGADIALASRSTDALETVAKEIEEIGRKALVITADMASDSDIQAMVKQTVSTLGSLDVLVYNAGILWIESMEDASIDVWQQTLNVNLIGASRAVHHALNDGGMLAQKSGSIIFVSSEVGKVGELGMGAYAASKHGMLGLMRCIGLELGPLGIRANAVCPGLIESDMSDRVLVELGKLYDAPEDKDERYEWAKDFDPQKRVAVPEDVADVVSFLASNDARAMTGQALNIATKIP